MEHTEQYSKASKRALGEATKGLVRSLELYASHVSGMHGGSSQMPGLFKLNDELARAVADWNEVAADHTGTFPISLQLSDDDLDDENGEDGADEDVPVAEQLSVISRWDLAIVDADAVISQGRKAHRRHRPEENKRDAEFAVHDVGSALYAITYETGERWYDIGGLEVIHGERLYIQPDEPLRAPDNPPDPDDTSFLVPPAGHVALGESWN